KLLSAARTSSTNRSYNDSRRSGSNRSRNAKPATPSGMEGSATYEDGLTAIGDQSKVRRISEASQTGSTIPARMKRAAAVLVAIGSLALAGARTERAVPFGVGETLTYDVSWSSYLTAGSATTIVTGKTAEGGSSVYTIVAEGRPTPLVASLYALHYRIES